MHRSDIGGRAKLSDCLLMSWKRLVL